MTLRDAQAALRAAVIVFPGSNGDRDLAQALAAASFDVRFCRSDEPLPADVQLVGLPGGFSYGDYWRAGMLASQAQAVRDLPAHLQRGGLVIGICNGFQILVEAGLLPGALGGNAPPGFRHRWLDVEVCEGAASSPWFHGLTAGTRLRLPMAHGEGRYLPPADAGAAPVRVPLRYCDNPNGSYQSAAALLDASGQVLGIMPHPERAALPSLGSADGLLVFRSAAAFLRTQTALAVRALASQRETPNEDRAQRRPASSATAGSHAPASPPVGVPSEGADGGSLADARSLGLTDPEYHAAVAALGRPPRRAELAVLAGMWSEHCSYKSTRPLLRGLPTSGPHVLAGPGAHAGVVDVGHGWAVAFKIESHNHPSAVDPYQGAATGVGGILRDIIAQGARPCALLDSLCFGDPQSPRTRHLQRGVVDGIAGYGNAVGVPNVGGMVHYDRRYEGNPLVNVLAAGLLRHDQLRTARAAGIGNALLYVGATTGRDGILGAAFASEALRDRTQQVEQRTRVQVGDPFAGKKLLEACVAFTEELGLVAGQDLGACGLACASFEMAAEGGIGAVVDLDAVPLREPDMTPVEILLSESQERFLFVVRAGAEPRALEHFRRHGLHAAVIGRLTEGPHVLARHHGRTVAELPAALVAGGAPLSDWPLAPMLPAAPPYSDFAPPADLNAVLLDLLARPDVADKSLIHDRFDQTVGNCTVRGPTQACAAVLQVPDSARGFALVLTGRGELCAVDPYLGAQAAVAEALRRLACAGARLLAITDGINCASPRDPIENRRLAALIQGLGDALRALDVPVTGGNVSLYNESPDGPIPPTPMVGGLGVIEDIAHVPASALQPGLEIFLLGALRSDPVTCRYGALRTGLLAGGVPAVDLAAEQRLAAWLLRQTRRVVACQPTRLGGLAVALAKLCVRGGCGATLDALPSARPDWALFGEYPAQVFVAVRPNDAAALIQDAEAAGIPWLRAGLSGGDALQIEPLPPIPLSVLASAYRGAKGPDARA